MLDPFFHTILNILWIVILTAIAAIATTVAYVAVKVIFFNESESQSKKQNNN